MELRSISGYQSLITEISNEVIILAIFLGIPVEVEEDDDHIFISQDSSKLELCSFFQRRDSDVIIPTEIFCEILMDVKAGNTLLEAFNKQGYTF